MDPRILINQIGELHLKLGYLADKRHSTIEDCSFHQQLGEEYAQRHDRVSRIRLFESQEQLESALDAHRDAEKAVSDATHLCAQAQKVCQAAQGQLGRANAKLHFWQLQLARANEWKVRAENRLSLAQAELAAALSHYHECEQKVAQAEAELAQARETTVRVCVGTDREGNSRYENRPIDTAPYEKALQEAMAEFRHAKARLARAREEVNEAQIELNRANHQVIQSDLAVRDCRDAVMRARNGVDEAQMGHRSALGCLDKSKHAERAAFSAVNAAESGVESCEQASALARRSLELMAESHAYIVTAKKYHEENFSMTLMTQAELDQKSDFLRAFDSPTLNL